MLKKSLILIIILIIIILFWKYFLQTIFNIPTSDKHITSSKGIITFRDDALWLQFQRPMNWWKIKTSQDWDFIVFSILNKENPLYTTEIMRLFFLNIDTYHTLSSGEYQWIPDFKNKVIGNNDKYYFLLWVTSEEFWDLANQFSIFPTQEVATHIELFQKSGNNTIYQNAEFWFNLSMPQSFNKVTIFTRHQDDITFNKPEFNTVYFTAPLLSSDYTNPFLPIELSGYEELFRILCVPINDYNKVVWQYLSEQDILGANEKYYFILSISDMSESRRLELTSGVAKSEVYQTIKNQFFTSLF